MTQDASQQSGLFDNALLDTVQLAAFLGVHEMTVRRWVMKRKIPFVKVGRSVRFEKERVLERLRISEEPCSK
jgi:excisionase family DNA binding protein